MRSLYTPAFFLKNFFYDTNNFKSCINKTMYSLLLAPNILQIASPLLKFLDVLAGGIGILVALLLHDLQQDVLNVPRHVTCITGGKGEGWGGSRGEKEGGEGGREGGKSEEESGGRGSGGEFHTH